MIDTTRICAVAYHNLGLYREDEAFCQEAASKAEMKHQQFSIKPLLNLDWMSALIGQPRFTLGEVDSLATEAQKLSEKRKQAHTSLEYLLAGVRAEAYALHGNLKKAKRILDPEIERLEHAQLGALDKAIFLKLCARLRYRMKDFVEWEYFITEALRTDVTAGFAHQKEQIQSEYGTRVEPILRKLEA